MLEVLSFLGHIIEPKGLMIVISNHVTIHQTDAILWFLESIRLFET